MHGPHDQTRGSLSSAAAAAVRGLPQVQRLLDMPEAAGLLAQASRPAAVAALREVLGALRAELLREGGVTPPPAAILARAARHLADAQRPALRRVLNATGIVLHTNLGRAPLAPEALEAATEAARGYTDLEFCLDAGGRGPRAPGVAALLRDLTGAQAGLAVNNCAAAVLLALSALAAGGEVIVSRGEAVEIGGGFRIPDVIGQGGARLVEVGTTNKTRLADYEAAITPATRVLLKVHPSNFRVVGFTAGAALPDLAALARARGLLLVYDLGGGAMHDLGRRGERQGRPHEPTVREAVAAGADVVAFSGDKLLGGPQAGLSVGQEAAIAAMRRHPLMRALRLDKLSLAALEATLRLHRDPARAAERIPVLRMLAQNEAALQDRAERLVGLLAPSVEATVVPSAAYAGGGTLPGEEIPSRAVRLAIPGLPADELARRLRLHRPAVVGRVGGGRVLLDVFALADVDLPALADAVRAVSA